MSLCKTRKFWKRKNGKLEKETRERGIGKDKLAKRGKNWVKVNKKKGENWEKGEVGKKRHLE